MVTGIGLVTPLGTGTERTWSGLVAGRSGVRRLTRFDASCIPAQIAGEVPDFEPERWLDKKEIRRTDPFVQYALAAAEMAMEEAGLALPLAAPERTGVIIGDLAVSHHGEAGLFDTLRIDTHIGELGRSNFRVFQRILREGSLIALVETGTIAFDYAARAIVPIPDAFRKALKHYTESRRAL